MGVTKTQTTARTPCAGARVLVDGAPYQWNTSMMLQPGSHSVVVSAGPGDSCCEETRQSVTVHPAAKGEEAKPETIVLSVTYRDAKAILSGAPPDGKLVCGMMGVTLTPGATATVKMQAIQFTETCTAISASTSATKTVTLTAGRSHTIPWP